MCREYYARAVPGALALRRMTWPARCPVSCPSVSESVPLTTTWATPAASRLGSNVVPRSPQHAAVGQVEAAGREPGEAEYNRLVLSSPERFRESVDRYADFLAACEARDGEAAKRAVQETIRWGLERVAGELPSEPELT